MRRVWVVGHRGASGHAPENTLAAYRRAVELGAGFIETDLRLSRDARLVAIHDATLERTTNGRGRVRDYTLAELRELDAGSWFSPEFAGERIPTFEEILAFARKSDVDFYLELKDDHTEGAEPTLVASLRGAQQVAPIVVLSFQTKALAKIRTLNPTLMTGWLLNERWADPADVVVAALGLGARQLAPAHELVTPELLETARREGLPVVAWTVNEPARMRELVALGVAGVMTDYPDRLVAALQDSVTGDQ